MRFCRIAHVVFIVGVASAVGAVYLGFSGPAETALGLAAVAVVAVVVLRFSDVVWARVSALMYQRFLARRHEAQAERMLRIQDVVNDPGLSLDEKYERCQQIVDDTRAPIDPRDEGAPAARPFPYRLLAWTLDCMGLAFAGLVLLAAFTPPPSSEQVDQVGWSWMHSLAVLIVGLGVMWLHGKTHDRGGLPHPHRDGESWLGHSQEAP